MAVLTRGSLKLLPLLILLRESIILSTVTTFEPVELCGFVVTAGSGADCTTG
jgi:hypothetical protein